MILVSAAVRTPCVIPNYNQQDAAFLDLFISTDAVHVSGFSSAHRQEHITVHTASGIVNQYCCLLLLWMRWNAFSSAHRQEHITVHTASGIVNQYCCLLLSWMRWNAVPSHP